MFNICMCGAQAGYQHAHDCPYPLFRGTAAQEEAWDKAREALADAQADLPGESRYAGEEGGAA